MANEGLAGSDNRSNGTGVSSRSELRRFGISLVGEIPWGTHLCQFYQTREDLIDILVPYFVEGLKSNEFCMWVTSPPLEVEDAKRALGEALPDLDAYVQKGQIEILSYRDWYLLGGSFDSDRVLQGWVQKEHDALNRGFQGLRLTGNTFWVERNGWKSFTDYEAAVNDVLPSHRMVALCTYSLDRCVGSDVVDVVRNHVGTLIRKGNTWCLVEDVAQRRKMEDDLRESQTKYRDLTETTGDFVWEMDSQGRYTYCSPQMEKLWGIKPKEMIGKTPFDLMPANDREKASEFFMAVVNSPKPFSGLETAANVGQGRLVFIETSGVPFFDNSGKLLGFRGVSRDITERKKAEEALRMVHDELETRVEERTRELREASAVLHEQISERRKAEERVESERKRLFYVLETLPTMVCLLTPDYHVAFANRSFREKFGESQGRHCYEYCYGQSQPCEFCKSYEVLKTGKPLNWQVVTPDGSTIDVHDFPFTDVDGSPMILEMDLDITEQKRAEAELKKYQEHLEELVTERTGELMESEKRFRMVVENSRDGINLLDLKTGKYTFTSPGQVKLTGFTAEEMNNFAAEEAYERTHPDDREITISQQKKVAAGEEIAEPVEYRWKVKSGEYRWFSDSRKLVRDEQGHPIAMVGISRDITTHKKAEEALKESEDRFRVLSETSPIGVGVSSADGVLLYTNPEYESILGYSHGELLGKKASDLYLNPDDRTSWLEVMKKGSAVRSVEIRLKRKDGTPVWVSINTSNIIYGGKEAVMGTIQDITERKKSEEALVKAETHYHALFDNIDEGFQLLEVMRDQRGEPCDFRYVELNKAYERQTGLKVSDVLGKTTSEVYPGAEKYWLDVFSSVEKTGLPTRFENYSEPLGRYYETYAFPFGKDHVGVLFRDITERKKAEEEIRSLSRFPAENPNIVLRISNDGKLLYSNPAGSTALNAWRAEVGMSVPDDWRKLVAEVAKAGTKKELEEKFDTRTFLLTLASVTDAGYVNVYGRDITKRIEAEQALRDSQRDLNRAQEVAKTGSWRLDVRQNELLWSDQTYRMFGIPKGKPMTYDSFLAAVHPEDREHVDQKWQAALRGEPYDIEHRILVNSEVKWVHEIAELETDEKGSLVGGFGTVQDITERKEMENSLRETTDYLDSLLNYANAPIIVWNPEFKITKFNHAFERLTGYKVDEAVGRDLSILFPEQTREKSLTEIQHTSAGEYWEVVEIPILRKDGDTRIVLWNSANIYGEDKRTLMATIAQGQDITERKQIEDALRETRDYLDSLLNYANAPIIVWDPFFKITRFNRAFERLTGYKADEVLGKHLNLLFPRQSRENSLAEIQHTLAGEYWDVVEIPILRKDGEVHTVLWNSANIYALDGKTQTATIAQGQDITERKKAEETLRETRDYLDSLLDYANAPMIVWDPTFRITRFNHAFEHLAGYKADEVVGKDLSMLFPAESIKESLTEIQHTLTGEHWESVEIPILRKDAEVHTVLWNSANIYAQDGKTLMATIAQGVDITERKRLEQKLKTTERMATIGETAAIVGHDLRNPLQAIVGFIGLAEEQLKTVKSPAVKKQKIMWPLRAISQQAQYMNKIVLDLQDYARSPEPELEKTQLTHLVKDVLSSLQVPPTIETSIQIPIKFPKVSIDPTLMRRALTNLCRNAVEAMPKGGRLTIRLSNARGEVSIEIRDTGTGIPKENIPKIFTPLFTTKAKGQGFGLPVSKQIIEAHGGTITVKSQPGKGSTFTLKIPKNKRNRKTSKT